MKNTKRVLAIILSLVLICTALPLSFAGFAQTGNGYAFAEELGAELGKNLYDHNFSELSEVPSDWSVVSGSAALGTSEQGGITKSGYSISGANGNMNTVRIQIPAKNYVVKLTMYQVTGYWGGEGGRVYIYKHGTNTGNEQYFEAAQIQLGGYKRTSWLPPANGAAIYKYDANGNTSNDTATRLEDIGGGFGTDGHSLNTLYIYSYEGTTYYVNEAGTLLGSSVDVKEFENNYITIAGDYIRILLSDFEAYELKKPSLLKGGYVYTEELGAEFGKNLYDHNFSELSEVPSDWSVVKGSADLGEIEQGGITKKGYSISGAYENNNIVRIKIPAQNFVAKFSAYQVTEYWGGNGGNFRIYKDGKNTGDTEYSTLAHIRLAGYASTTWLTPANGATIFKYDAEGNTSNDTAIRLEDIGGGFGADGHSLNTIYLYSYNGTTYYVNEAGTLLGSTEDSNTFDETYITLEGNYNRILLSDFEVYELDGENSDMPYNNLILNGKFKEDTSNWIPCTSGVTLSYNEEGYATATVKKKGWCELYSNVFEVKENYDLVFEFDYKTAIDYDTDVFTAYLFLYTAESMEGKNKETLGADGSIPSGYKSASLMLIPNTSWKNGVIEYTVPEGYTYGQVRFAFRGSVPVGDSFSVDNVSVYRLTDIFDRINEAIDEENVNAFKELIKDKSAGIKHEIITVDSEFMSALKAFKTEKGEDLTASDIYTVSIKRVTDIGSQLELFVEDSLIDLNNTTASFVTMSPKFEEQTLDLSGGFRCEDANNDKYNGSFDATNLTEDTRPWEHLGGDYCEVVKDGDIYRMYYRGADDGILTANAYTLYGGDDPLASYMNICYAESKDGINWYRPELGIHEFIMDGENIPNNIMLGDIKENFDGSRVSSFSVAIDTSEDCPADERYKGLLANVKAQGWGYSVYALKSADGIHWEKMNNGVPVINDKVGESFDSHNVVIYNEKTDEFVLYFRRWATDPEYGRQRIVSMLTSKDFISWDEVDNATNLDYYSNETAENLKANNANYDGDHPDNYQLYTNGIFVYDRAPHLTLGMPTRYLGDSTGHEVAPYFIASRDGINFKFWDDKLIENSAELDRDGNRSNYSLTGIVRTSETEYSMFASRGFKDSVCIFDRFSFRVDGFVAATGDASGKIVTTTPVTFSGNSLIVNFKAPSGTVRAQLTDANGNVLEGFGFADCTAITGDSIEQELKFKGDLSTINQPVKISFELTNAELYSYKFEEAKKDVVTFGGASILTAEAEKNAGHQAMRFFATYSDTEDIVERGFILSAATENEITVDSKNVVKLTKKGPFNSCWSYKDGNITYSTYIVGFDKNDTRVLTVRAYAKTADGEIHYTEQKSYSVDYIKKHKS